MNGYFFFYFRQSRFNPRVKFGMEGQHYAFNPEAGKYVRLQFGPVQFFFDAPRNIFTDHAVEVIILVPGEPLEGFGMIFLQVV